MSRKLTLSSVRLNFGGGAGAQLGGSLVIKADQSPDQDQPFAHAGDCA